MGRCIGQRLVNRGVNTMQTTQNQLDQINAAEIWWRTTGRPEQAAFMRALCVDHLAGKKVFKVDGNLAKAYEERRQELHASLEVGKPQNVVDWRVFSAVNYSGGYTVKSIARYTVRGEPDKWGVSGCRYVEDWYLSLECTPEALATFDRLPALKSWEPLTLAEVDAARVQLADINRQIEQLKARAGEARAVLSVVGEV